MTKTVLSTSPGLRFWVAGVFLVVWAISGVQAAADTKTSATNERLLSAGAIGSLLPVSFLSCQSSKPSACAQPPEAIFALLNNPGFWWQAPQKQELFGVPLHIRQFTSELELHDAARVLAQNKQVFQRLLSLPGKITLSGLLGGWHWLAELDRVSGQVVGRVSAMAMQHSGPGVTVGTDGKVTEPPIVSQKGRLPWLAGFGRLHFSHKTVSGQKDVLQEIYSFSQVAGAVKTYIDRQLTNNGWRESSSRSLYPGAYVWRNAHSQLAFTIKELTPGARMSDPKTAVFIHYF